ncbi:methyl-accepting chemotaxis protein [Picosynechococcus sp. PCC 7002]|uniref:methyl-accepting chemotaxis protein n=2 Tax=Picosynechococcus sp. (strain ATCC 27264 / PCC 7002 / PR-6) TaxID=32049 RepID=UPI00016DCB3D|nr:methyl-accepting chemotaxis protein [Picosynechococcus sp. PCC 7002]ACA99368.1 methyl-accepting chemotaxis protein [Picosynechococcus sp. PCC 7002]
MPPSTTDYSKEYAEAQKAYYQNNLPEAEAIANRLLKDYPDDPHLLLLSGHISLGLQDLGRASAFYHRVLDVTNQRDYHEYARQGLTQVNAYSDQVNGHRETSGGQPTLTQPEDYPVAAEYNSPENFVTAAGEQSISADDYSEQWAEPELPLRNFPEDEETFLVPHPGDRSPEPGLNQSLNDPFFEAEAGEFIEFNEDELVEFDSAAGLEEDGDFLGSEDTSPFDLDWSPTHENGRISADQDHFDAVDTAPLGFESESPTWLENPPLADADALTFDEPAHPSFAPDSLSPDEAADFDDEISLGSLGAELFDEEPEAPPKQDEGGFLEEFGILNEQDLDDFGDLGSDILDDDQKMPDTGLFEAPLETPTTSGEFNFDDFPEELGLTEDDSLFITLGEDSLSGGLGTDFTVSDKPQEIVAENPKGYLAWFENVPLQKKQLFTATGAAAASVIATLIVTVSVFQTTPAEQRPQTLWPVAKTGLLTSLLAGAASFGTTLFFGKLTTRQIKRSTDNLQNQFDAVSQGNLNVKATVFAEDEFGALATGFNKMARVILNTTSEAQRRAEETEQSKEDLQRQVIRLLDDVEGAARGDFTVQAEVTADVLGAVADAFNLTIQNLREIVQQVKQAARQVNKNAADSESFARGLSSDALRQAEELAVTLNSVQMMTDSIQRVAENAREAEEVARTASSTALKGGESVEHTVAGILQIRETVAETARKVKRLAESSQEISKIVAVVSQIASRTNLLALNASIEAARAGESGKGFAIVADEVRQLADRSAKALKEIEQIVLQIQSETSSVMTAMEEGTQQVIDGTKRAEQAKQSLEDIIQVSNRIDALVRSITADTVEQRENSRAVAQVMQSVELTAQETSRESQRVAGSLQKLVGIARDLLASVERFRIESTDEA